MRTVDLEASPIARLLISVAEQAASGELELADRRLAIWNGDIFDIHPSEGDGSLEQFLVDSALVSPEALSRARAEADLENGEVEAILVRHGLISERNLSSARRSLWLDRLVRSLRQLRRSETDLPRLEPGTHPATVTNTVRLVPLVLDALARCATDEDAQTVGARLDYRIDWLPGPSTELGKKWAALGSLPERPAVSTVLLRTPAAATSIAALERAGLIRLVPPGGAPSAPGTTPISLPPPSPRTSTLPPPSIPCFTESSLHDLAAASADRRPAREARPSREVLAVIPVTELPDFRLRAAPFEDPIGVAEDTVDTLDQSDAPAPDRARALCRLGRAWETSLGAIEEAARAYGDAAAADPYLEEAPAQAARLCLALGDLDSSLAYARVASVTAPAGKERARALRRLASLARRKGDTDSCLESLCEAAAEDENDTASHERIAGILADRGDPAGAVAHLRAAVRALGSDQPERARSLCALAYSLSPGDPDLGSEYAHLLEGSGRGAAAASVLGDLARGEQCPDRRRDLRSRAALLAEEHGRADLAAELLLEAFDEEPHVDLFHAPLFENLKASGTPEEIAIVSEEIAAACPIEQKAFWYTRAGNATLGVRDAHDRAMFLLATAVETDPERREALEVLERHAVSFHDHMILADCLQRAADVLSRSEPLAAVNLLEKLAEVAEERLGSVYRPLYSWNRIREIKPDHPGAGEAVERLTDKARIRQALVERVERELEEAAAGDRPDILLRLAPLLLDRAEDRARALEAYRVIAAVKPNDENAFSTLAWLLSFAGRDEELVDLLRARLASVSDAEGKKPLLAILASLQSRRADHRAAAETCTDWLALTPGNAEAVTRLDRSAVKLNDVSLLCAARSQGVGLSRTARQRGLALVRLARILETSSRFDEAVSSADGALAADPTSAEAALLLLRHVHRLPPERALVVIGVIRSVLGDSAPLLSLEANAARVARDQHSYLQALESWSRLSPFDSRPLLEILRLMIDAGTDPSSIATAARRVMGPDIVDPSVSVLTGKALQKVSDLGAHEEAFLLAMDAQAALGESAFAVLALREAEASGNSEFQAVALERVLPFCKGEERRNTLQKLSELYFAQQEKAGELHALMRLIAISPADLSALDRIAVLYAENGEVDKLLSVLSLTANAAVEPDLKRQKVLDLAAAYAIAARDPMQAEECIRSIIFDFPFDEPWALKALGAFFSFGDRQWAVDRILSLANEAPSGVGASMFQWMAATAESELDDLAGALAIVVHGLELFPHHAGLLLLMERYTRKTGDIDTAVGTYDRLADQAMGKHGRRALYYRAGRWLEEMQRPEQALAYYRKAFDLAPGPGLLFNAIERLALQMNAPAIPAPFEPTGAVGRDSTAEAVTPENGDPARLAEAAHLLRTQVRGEPWNTEAIRSLHRLLPRIGARVEAGAASEIVSVFDASVVPAGGPIFSPGICPLSEIEACIEPESDAGRRRLLELVWEAVRTMPRFTDGLGKHGVEGKDRIPIGSPAPLAAAFARACAMLKAEVPLFLQQKHDRPLYVAATNPPALLVSSGLQNSAVDMVFSFGRCIWLARPENVLVAALSEDGMELLLSAVWAAFAPPSSCGEVSREAKRVASDLWQAMPVRSQQEVRGLMQTDSALGDRKRISGRVHEEAARAGLLASGSVRGALLSLPVLDPSLQGVTLGDEAGFQAACRASAAFAEIIRFSLSSAYLAIRALA